MSTTNVVKSKLSPEQTAANRAAIHSYIANATAKSGRGSVILLPEFSENDNGEWQPVQGNGIRPTSNNSAFLRFGKMTINPNGKIQYLYTNHFGDNEGELANMLAFIDPTATIGSAVKGVRLVIHESLAPFSRTTPERDIKWADQGAGIACTKNIVDPSTGEVTGTQPIYRRTKVFFADDEGYYAPQAVNQLIAHDNSSQISEHAFNNRKNAQAGMGAAREQRIAELKAIPAAKRNAQQKLELAELMGA